MTWLSSYNHRPPELGGARVQDYSVIGSHIRGNFLSATKIEIVIDLHQDKVIQKRDSAYRAWFMSRTVTASLYFKLINLIAIWRLQRASYRDFSTDGAV